MDWFLSRECQIMILCRASFFSISFHIFRLVDILWHNLIMRSTAWTSINMHNFVISPFVFSKQWALCHWWFLWILARFGFFEKKNLEIKVPIVWFRRKLKLKSNHPLLQPCHVPKLCIITSPSKWPCCLHIIWELRT